MLDCGWWIARLLLVFLSTVLLRPATAAVRADDGSSASRVLLAQARHRDTTPPVLVLTAPSEGAIVTTPTISVRGSVTDEGAVTVWVEGQRVPVRAGVFAVDVSLRRGPNQIEVEAIDAAGNRTRVSREVRFEDLRRIQALVPPVLVAADLPTLGHLTLAPDGAILVTAPQAGRIYRVPADGSPSLLHADHLRDPLGIAAAGDGSLFVAERGADRILRLAPDGTRAVVLEQLDDPRGLALGREGDLFITAIRWRAAGAPRAPEAHRGVVMRRDLATGAVRVVAEGLVAPEGIVAGGEDAEESFWVVAERRQGEPEWRDADLFRITLAGTVTPIPGPHLWRPLAIARDALGTVWLTARRQYGTPDDLDDDADEWERGVLFKVSPAGLWQRFAAHLDEASGLAFAAQGDLLVVEADRGRILRFRAPPALEVIHPSPTSAPTVTLTGTAEPLAMIVARGPAGTGTGLTDAEGRFQVSVPLLPGQPNRIEVFAVAAAGAGLASAPTVITTVQESMPPALVVETPPPNALTNGSPIPVRGRVTGGSPPVQVFVNEAAVPVDVSGEFGAMLPLLEGPNEIRVRVVDAAGAAATVTRTATLDTTPPNVAVMSPAEGAVVTGTTVAVMGMVSDANPPATVSVNGQAVPLAPNGQFGSEILLSITQSTITVTATDRAGNVASAIRQVVRDATPPALGYVSVPPDPTNSSTLTVTVAATDTITPADQIQFAFSLDSAIFSPYATVPTMTYPGVTSGVHTIRAKARDQVGNESAPIAMTVRVDTVPPAITLTAPATNFLTNAPQIGVSGSVADASAITEVAVNDQAASLVGSIFTATVTLAEGANSLVVSARDAAGNLGTATVAGTLDTTAPTVIITAPATGFLTNQPALTVIGTVTDAAAIVEVTVNGQAVPLTGTGFSRSLVLGEGANTITVTARDATGNLGIATVSGILDTRPPVLTFTAPAADAVLNTTPLTVTGTVSEAVTSLSVNGSAATVSDGTFSVSLVPTRGRTTLTATATDPAGNVGSATRSVTFDDVAPVVRILTPASGQILSQTSLTVTGTVDESSATVTVNGVAATISGGLFTASGVAVGAGAVTLTAQATDAAGNVGTAQITFTVDTTPPTLGALTVPGEVTAGTAVTLAAEASDNLGIATLDLLVDGRLVASGTTSPVSVSFTIPPDKAVNETLTVTARAVDVAGQTMTQLATMRVTGAAVGPGFLRGLVLDDTKSLPLAGATVTVTVEGAPSVDPQATGADGQYAFSVDPGTAVVRITKDGTTAGERKIPVRSDLLSTVADARLTPRDTAVSLISASGGTAADTTNTLRLTLPAGALTEDASITLTAVSSQGLIARLPLGWTPILVADLAPASLSLAAAGTLSVRVPEAWQALLPAATAVTAARYDAAQGWVALDTASVTNDGLAIEAAIPITGQVAFLLPDAAPQAPPAPVTGQPLTGVAFAAIPEDATAVGAVTPTAIPPGTSIATGQVTVTPTTPLPSGTLVQAVVSETYTLLTGEDVTPPSFVQELVLYQSAIQNSQFEMPTLSATFPVTLSRQYTLKDLAIGTVHVALQTPETGGQGTIIGPEGGTITAADGTIFTIPAGALTRETVVAFASLAESDLRVAVPAGFQVLKAITLDLTRATLSLSAELAFPLPAGITADTQVLVARVIEVDGVLKLQAVGVGQASGGLLSSRGTVSGVSLPGITSGGTYVALRATSPVGFVAGTITDAASAAKAGILVSSSTGLVDVSRSDGRYLVAVTAGSASITATDRATGQGATQAVTVGSGTGTTQPLQVQVIPPTVVSVTPAAAARNIPVNSTVTVTFSQAIAKASLSASSLVLSGASGPVEATLTLSPLGTEATLYPSNALASQTTYSLVASQAIQDTHGTPLPAPFTSQFTTASAPPPPPPAGAITVSFPDDQGNVTVTATQGTATPDTLTVVINTESGSITSATVSPDGSFTASLFAQLGDELLVVLRDEAGRQTVVSAGAYVHPDGRRIVTAGGGSIPVAGGATLTIAPQAVTTPTTLRTSVVDPSEFPIALPPGYRVLPGLKIELDRALKIGARLSMPLPQGFALSPDARPFLARTQVIAGETVLVMVDSMRVLNNELTTSSPPFDDLKVAGAYHAVIPGVPTPVLIQGVVTTTLPNGAIAPLPGIVIGVASNPQVVMTRDDGSFAIYAYPTGGDTQTITISAVDPPTRTSKSASISTTVVAGGPVASYRIDFDMPGGLQLVDTTPPKLTLALSGSEVKGSVIPVRTETTITITATDDRAVSDGTATILLNGGALPVKINPGNTYTARFVADTIGLAQIEAQVADTSGNIGRVVRRIQVIDPATRPGSLAGAPVVLETRPAEDAAQVSVFDNLYIRFSEPVRNLTAETVRLEKLDASGAVAGAPIPLNLSPDVPDSTIDLFIYPQQNLEFATRYRLTITTGIHDRDAEPEGTSLAADDVRDFATVGLTKVPEKLASGNLRGVEPLDDTRLVLLDRRAGLRVVDVTDPSNPKPFGDFTLPWAGYYIGFQALKVVPDFAYKASYSSVVKTPVAVVVGYLNLPGEPISGNLAVVSLATPASPRVIGRAVLGIDTNAVPMDVLVKGSYAVVGSLGAGLQVVDLDEAIDAYACELKERSSCIGTLRDFTSSTGSAIYEDPLVQTYGFGAQPIAAPFGLVASKKDPNTAYVAERSRGIYRVDLGGLPLIEKTLLFSTPALHLALAEDVQRSDGSVADLLILGTPQGISVLNLKDRNVPPATLSVGSETGVFGITAHSGHGLAFVTTGTGGMAVVDLRGQQPTLVGTAPDLGFANGSVTVNNQFAYIAAAGTGLEVVRYHPEGITLDLVDALAFEPWGDPDNGLQGFKHVPASDMIVDQEMRREGALADGASLLVLRVKVPPYGVGDEPVDLRLTFTLTDPEAPPSQTETADSLGSLYDGMSGWPPISDPNVNDVPIQATIVIRTTPKKGGLGAVVYRPPIEFVRNDNDKAVVARSIPATMTFDSTQVRGNYALRALQEATELAAGRKPLTAQVALVRPPLLLVHGIYSSKETWRALNDTLQINIPRAFIYVPVDYSDRNNSNFDNIYTAVRDTMKTTLTNLRQGTIQADDFNRERLLGFRRIAATRMDLLAHSMGGLATRFYLGQTAEFRRPDNYFLGDLRRIVTVGTPYKGAAIARWFEWKWWPEDTQGGVTGQYRPRTSDPVWVLKQNLGKGNTLALRDMTPGSQVQRQFERVRDTEPINLRGPRVHTVIGTTNNQYGVESAFWFSRAVALEAMPLEPGQSDRIVCVKSQRGATLLPKASSSLSGITHTQEPSSAGLRLQLLKLLNQADGNTQFDGGGMPPSGEMDLDVPWEFTCPE